jgi:hypothetical protein
MALLDNNGIATIKNILNDFAILSGLKCNVEKSQILVTGTDEIPEFIRQSGFSVANEIKILGFTVTRDFADFEKNIDNAVAKIKKIAAFWSRFKLSLPGSINVNLREFSFKFRNNILGINTRVSHFNRNVDRACMFCRITECNNAQLPDESFIHIFFECPSTKRVLDNFFTQYLNWNIDDRNGMKRILFTGMDPDMSTPIFFCSQLCRLFYFICGNVNYKKNYRC